MAFLVMDTTTNKIENYTTSRDVTASGEHSNLMSAVRHVAGLLGMSAETLRVWHRRREVDAGAKPGVPSDVAEENKCLRREVAEL